MITVLAINGRARQYRAGRDVAMPARMWADTNRKLIRLTGAVPRQCDLETQG